MTILILTREDFEAYLRQSNISTFKHGLGRYDTETVCECLTCSIALRQKQIQNSVPIGFRRQDGFAVKKGTLRIESGAFKDCYICAPCKKALGSDVFEIASIPEDTPIDVLHIRLESFRSRLLTWTMLHITDGSEEKQQILDRALELRLLGDFSQSAGLPEYAYDFARLQRLLRR